MIKAMLRNCSEIKVESNKSEEAYKQIVRLADRWFNERIIQLVQDHLMTEIKNKLTSIKDFPIEYITNAQTWPQLKNRLKQEINRATN